MIVVRVSDTELRVPTRAQTGNTIGDALMTITPQHKDWERWQDAISRGLVSTIDPSELAEFEVLGFEED